MPGLLAALWLLGLYAAAPALRGAERYEFADRLRDALILGIAIPLGLGLLHLFYPLACWVVLAILCAIAARRAPARPQRGRTSRGSVPYVLIAVLLLVAWPQLVRPLLDGDSLSYHLPNAAAWTQAHSLWTTATRYWWYPPGSELFASALYAVAGPFALPWSGLCALTLLGVRIVAWARQWRDAPPLLGDALAAATIGVYPLAIQGGTLQNDVWLAAFWLEALWTLRGGRPYAVAARTLAVTALLKPQGWMLAAIALLTSRAKLKYWLAALAALTIWAVRDAMLRPGAAAAPSQSAAGALWNSTILAHGLPALGLLAGVTLHLAPFALLALIAALAGPLVARDDRALGWAGFSALALFGVLPFGYETSVPQLATGASLRFAAPAIAAGALILGFAARRVSTIAVPLLLISSAYGCWFVLAIFWNDGSTHTAVAIAAIGVAVAAGAHIRKVAWPAAAAVGLGIVLATHLAARHPLDYYDDALRVGATPPGVYRWIATTRPAAIGGWGLRVGVVNVLSPGTRTSDLPDRDPCRAARRAGVLVGAVAERDLDARSNARRLNEARDCGRPLYADASAVVVVP